MYLKIGEKVTVESLLYGLMLRSGNDGAEAIAGWCCGSREKFIARMNERAARLGMTDSHFADPSGLSDEGHWSSAYDMALLARACLAQPELAKIVSTRAITLEGRALVNHNKLLWRCPGCLGMKTGYTKKAGRTLVSAAEREGMTLICVTLNDPDDWADHIALLDWAFGRFAMEQVVRAGETLCRLPVGGSLLPFCPAVAGEGAALCLAQGEQPRLRLELDRTTLTAPVAAGEILGRAVYELEGAALAAVPLETGAAGLAARAAGRRCQNDDRRMNHGRAAAKIDLRQRTDLPPGGGGLDHGGPGHGERPGGRLGGQGRLIPRPGAGGRPPAAPRREQTADLSHAEQAEGLCVHPVR